ncbi:helix-turn-helix transcriptional regulator [Simiduia sp. 21SJ11W-1]|uniref:winged helix-turn-helix transcriptional regulator n=1 Tax=Simiduia sp. 21SJ11W-1 TaxID=2909669 RepID=UPI00209D1C33|nr:helix-turn-helix domain-containing protein [Simiduia sp. 21SJ11W-1]UTA47678.1 helix-turn-helix transcriptional regulator [Simiduia sp. 21SJ11W-1]
MVKNSFSHLCCPVARSMDVVGEAWSMLVLRNLMLAGGAARFDQMVEELGISRNILTERLKRLEAEEILTKQPVQEGGRRMEYKLTAKGWELMPIMIGFAQWFDRWRADPERSPLTFLDRRDGEPIQPLRVLSHDGRPLGPADIRPVSEDA